MVIELVLNGEDAKFILETLVKFGANKDILYETKPHVGTDVLRNVIINIRKYMVSVIIYVIKIFFNKF